MSKSKSESVLIGMRLPVDVVARLDELAMSINGSRGTVVMDLVSRAEVRETIAPMRYLTVMPPDEAREAARADD